jgi:glycosyltransferase involved in cell wall biosynthesis
VARRIALISLPIDSVPPKGTSPHNTLIGQLADGLVEKGHEVILYATADSTSKAAIRSLHATGLRYTLGKRPELPVRQVMFRVLNEYNFWAVQDAIAAGVDLIHVHDTFAIDWHRWLRPKMVCTVHLAQTAFAHGDVARFWLEHAEYYRNAKLVFISLTQRSFYPEQVNGDVVYNGIDCSQFGIGNGPRDYLATLSRISRGKGVHLAIEIARKLGIPLKIAGPIDEWAEADPRYFRDDIAPNIDGNLVSYVGELGRLERVRFLQGAKVLLHPIQIPESFGLTLIEAMACGTPAISLDRGAARELIIDGKNGHVVGSVDDMTDAVASAVNLEPQGVRDTVVDRFSIARMVDGYVRVYESALDGS